MAANPQLVTSNTTVVYDGVTVQLMRGVIIDVPNGSALATALSGKVIALSAQNQIPGSSDSLGAGSLAAGQSGHTSPYSWGQAG
jgi:hypothetical protein